MPRKEKRVGVLEAKTHLSSLLRDVERGTDVIVVRGGRPVARIARMKGTTAADSYGLYEGQFSVADDFDADAEELADLFGIERG